MRLTKLLYFKDECEYSFLIALLEKKNIDECYFWITELYISGFCTDVWELILNIYYTHYNIKTSKLLQFIVKYYEKWNAEKNFIYILNIVKKMFYSDYCFTVFNVIHKNNKVLPMRGRKPNFLLKYKNISKTDERMLLSIYKQFNANIHHYIINSESLVNTRQLLNSHFKTGMYNETLTCVDEKLQLFSNCLRMMYMEYKINKCIEYNIKISSETYNEILKHHSIEKIPRHTLENRLYPINEHIGYFNVCRIEQQIDPLSILNECWLYYVYRYSPYWRRILKKYKLRLDKKKKRLDIVDDDTTNFDDFYDKFNIEPDEQPMYIKEKSCTIIKKKQKCDFEKYFITN